MEEPIATARLAWIQSWVPQRLSEKSIIPQKP